MKKEQTLLIFERKIFRIIYGPKYKNGEWKSRTNRELAEMSKGENIVKWIKGQRIRWLGHQARMEEDRIPKQIFIQELEGTRRRGRPRKGWKEEEERDLQVLGMRRWRELMADRKKWKDIVCQAKSPQWAVVPMEEEGSYPEPIHRVHMCKSDQHYPILTFSSTFFYLVHLHQTFSSSYPT